MAKKIIKFKSRVSVAKPDDVHKGWIRISNNLRGDISNGAYVKLSANNRKVYCQVRGTLGKAKRIEIGKAKRIEINEFYRNMLGWTDPPKEVVEFTIKEVCVLRKISALSSHPDDIVRVSIGLGFISVGLALLSMLKSFFPQSIQLIAGWSLPSSVVGFMLYIITLLLALAVPFLLCMGVWMFVRTVPKPIGRNASHSCSLTKKFVPGLKSICACIKMKIVTRCGKRNDKRRRVTQYKNS